MTDKKKRRDEIHRNDECHCRKLNKNLLDKKMKAERLIRFTY